MLSSVEEALDRSYSHVIVTTKVIKELQLTSELLSPLLTATYTERYGQPTYVLMQNGINIEVDLVKALRTLEASPRVIGISLWIATKMVDGNIVEHSYFVSLSPQVFTCAQAYGRFLRIEFPWGSIAKSLT